MQNPKIALVHDWLTTFGGAEQCLEAIYSLFPSPIFTLLYDPDFIRESPYGDHPINASFLQSFPFAHRLWRHYFPFYPLAIENLDLSAYDVILSSSHAVAKGVLTHPNQLHICYCYTPMRYAWDLYHFYLSRSQVKSKFKRIIAKFFLHKIRSWDINSANRPDHFIAISHFVAKRIEKIYGRKSEVIYPPVNTNTFQLEQNKENFFLTASRLVPYKRIDLIVDTFKELPHLKLVVIGDGPEMAAIRAKAGKNVELLGYQPLSALQHYMKTAKAFLFAAEEDFGIVPVEAQACGTPVIAFGRGGSLETVVHNTTGILYFEQTVKSLREAILAFEGSRDKFDPKVIREHAEKFSLERFRMEYSQFVQTKIAEFKSGYYNR